VKHHLEQAFIGASRLRVACRANQFRKFFPTPLSIRIDFQVPLAKRELPPVRPEPEIVVELPCRKKCKESGLVFTRHALPSVKITPEFRLRQQNFDLRLLACCRLRHLPVCVYVMGHHCSSNLEWKIKRRFQGTRYLRLSSCFSCIKKYEDICFIFILKNKVIYYPTSLNESINALKAYRENNDSSIRTRCPMVAGSRWWTD
jgi:hypothetical protein